MGNTPNLLFIMCDQLRFDSLAVHGTPLSAPQILTG